MCNFIKFCRHVNHVEMTNSIDFGGQGSKVKVTIENSGYNLLNTIEIKLFSVRVF